MFTASKKEEAIIETLLRARIEFIEEAIVLDDEFPEMVKEYKQEKKALKRLYNRWFVSTPISL